MCIIFLKPEKVRIPIATLKSAWDANKDGWGIMRPGRGKPFIRKGIKSFQQFLDNYQLFEDHACAIHFRQGTSGGHTNENAHPFHVKDDLWMMHNGVFQDIPILNKNFSDTYHFAELLSNMTFDVRGPEIDYILSNQKNQQRLVFMDQKGFTLINEDGWFRDAKGVYYSNNYAWNVPEDLQLWLGDYEIVLPNKGKLKARISKNLDKYRFWWQQQVEYNKEAELSERDQAYIPSDIEGTKRSIIDGIMSFNKDDIVNFCKTDPALMVEVIKSTLPKITQ